MNQTLRTILAYIPVVALIIVILSQPFVYGEIERWALIVFFVSFALDYFVNRRYRTFAWTRDKWVFVAFIVFFLMIYLWNIGGEQPRYFLKIIEQRLPYLGFGIIGILGLIYSIFITIFYSLHWFLVSFMTSPFSTLF